MNDEFLNKYYEKPRSVFADALYERISQEPKPLPVKLAVPKLTFRHAAIALAFLFLVAACVYAVSEKRWQQVGEIWVNVQKTYKVDFTSWEEQQFIPEPECLSIEDARKILRFDLHIPTWAPDGFTLYDRICGIDRISDIASLYWKGADKYSGINIMSQNLRIFNISTQKYEIMQANIWEPVAPGSYEEVQVLGQPAVLVHGDWEEPYMTEPPQKQEYEFRWDKRRGLQLHWIEGDVMYQLFTHAQVSVEDLIRMAESAR